MFSPKKEQHNAFYRNLDDNVLIDLQLIDLRLIDLRLIDLRLIDLQLSYNGKLL